MELESPSSAGGREEFTLHALLALPCLALPHDHQPGVTATSSTLFYISFKRKQLIDFDFDLLLVIVSRSYRSAFYIT